MSEFLNRAIALISDPGVHESLLTELKPLAVDCLYAFDPADFWEMFSKGSLETVIVEQKAMGISIESFTARVNRVRPGTSIVLLADPTAARPPVSKGLTVLSLPLSASPLARVLNAAGAPSGIQEIVGSSEYTRNLRERIALFAKTDSTVLLLGESGVGKELVARAIHQASPRVSGPFVAMNCGAIPIEIIESELFGHVRGAFTGADRDRKGHFELASGGTLFLDEIGTMRLDHQVRLLRVLQDRVVTPVGATNPIPVDVRVIAATNADLTTLIETGHFREDLFYRLNVLLLTVPPLRERRDDIPDLARHFVGQYARKNGLRERLIAPDTMERLSAHPWKGNVRELQNAIEHAMVLSHGKTVIDPLDLPGPIGERRRGLDRGTVRLTPDGIDLNDVVSRIERDMILQSLAMSGGNKSKAAELLKLKRTTFVEKMRRLDLGEAGLDADPGKDSASDARAVMEKRAISA